MCEVPLSRKVYEYSKSYPALPRDHIQCHPQLRKKAFVPSYEKPCAPEANMTLLLSWHYGRLWPIELGTFLGERTKRETIKQFKPDLNYNRDRFAKMLEKKRFVKATPQKGKNWNAKSRIDNGKRTNGKGD